MTQDEADAMVVNDIYLLRAAKALQSALEGAAHRSKPAMRRRMELAARDLELARQRARNAITRQQGSKWALASRDITRALNWIARASQQLSKP